MALLEELRREEQRWSDDSQDGSGGEESLSESVSFGLNELESDSGPGQQLKRFLQDTDPSVSDDKDSEAQEWWHKKDKDGSIQSTCVSPLFQTPHSPCCPCSPLPSQQDHLRQWAGLAAKAFLKKLGSEEWQWSDDSQACSDGGERLSLSSSFDANGLESDSGPEKLQKLFLQDRDPSVSDEEDTNAQESWLKKNKDVTIHTIWVNPLCPALMVEPGSLEAEKANSDRPRTSPAPAAPTGTQPAAPTMARAPEVEEQHVSGPAQAQGVAQTAAPAASGAQAAAEAESRAAAPHSPCCPPSPRPSQLEELRPWAGPAVLALLEELWGEEESCSEELSSGPSTEWPEDTEAGRMAEEESASGSLQSEPLPEDTEPGRMSREEIGSVTLPREVWTEDDISLWLLPCESWACTAPEDGRDQLEAALMCPSHVYPPLHMGTGVISQQSEEGSLSQMEDMESDGRQMQAVLGATWREEQLLRRHRRSLERLQGLRSAAAVPVRRPCPFRRALRALHRAFRNRRHLIPGLH